MKITPEFVNVLISVHCEAYLQELRKELNGVSKGLLNIDYNICDPYFSLMRNAILTIGCRVFESLKNVEKELIVSSDEFIERRN